MSNDSTMLLSTKYSDDQHLANGKRDSFFESVARCLQQLKPESECSPKSLRDICLRFARRNADNEHSWLWDSLQQEGLTVYEYISRLESTEYYLVKETETALWKLNKAVWGMPDIEGRIICEEYDLRMHVIKLTSVGKGQEEYKQQMISKLGSEPILANDMKSKDGNIIHLFNKDKSYFEPILDKTIDYQFLIENLEKARRFLCMTPKAGNAAETEFSNDIQLLEVYMRLGEFVSYFVKEFEAKLHSYFMIMEGEAKKAGKFSEKLSAGVGQAAGGLLGAPFGSLFMKLLAQAGKSIGRELGDKKGYKHHEGNVAAVMDLVLEYVNKKEEMRDMLVKVGIDIFQSFEMQFINVTTDFGPLKSMQLVARDAVNRIVGCHRSDRKGISISEGVIFGESKIESIWGVPVPSSKFKTPGFEVYYKTGEVWNTGSLYKKAGLVVEEMNSRRYYKNIDGQSRPAKYGYRRLLQTQNVDKIDAQYVIVDPTHCEKRSFENYKYILKPENIKDISKLLLKEINLMDKNLSEQRIKEIINEGRDDIIMMIRNIKEQILQSSVELKESLCILETNLSNMNIEEYFKQFLNYLQDAHKTSSGNFDKAHKHREVIAHDSKQEHGKTQAHIESIKKKIDVLQTEQETLIKTVTVTRKSIRFEVRPPGNSFVGREQELKVIADNIQQAILVISGSSGSGKTEMAIKFIHSQCSQQDSIIWIDASTKSTAKHSFHRLAEKELDIKIKDKAGEEKSLITIVKSVFDYFANKKCLFIFDNAREYTTLKRILQISLNNDSGEHLIMITSDNASKWEKQDSNITVLPPLTSFNNLEAVELFREILEMKIDSDEEHNIVQLAEKLNNHPLFLQYAAIYIKNEQKEYERRDFEYDLQNYNRLLGERRMTDTEIASKIWKIMIKKVERQSYSHDALSIFSQIAYFVQDNIREDLFLINNEDSDIRSLINLLEKYCIIHLEKGSMRIHGLTQEAIRVRLKQSKQEESTLEKTLKLMQDKIVFPPHLVSIWVYAKEYDALIENCIVEDDSAYKYFCIIAENSSDGDVVDILNKVEKHHPEKLYDVINSIGRKGTGTALHCAIRGGNERTSKFLIEKGADVDACDNSNLRPVHLAVQYGLDAVVKTLLERKADVNSVTSDKYKLTPLHLASHNGDKLVVSILLENRANINARTQTGNTSLHLASENGHVSVVDTLLRQPMLDIAAENSNNLTALDIASKKGYLGVVKLLSRGAKVNALDEMHFRPQNFAAQQHNVNIVKEIIVNEKIDAQPKQGNMQLQLPPTTGQSGVIRRFIEKKGPSKVYITLPDSRQQIQDVNQIESPFLESVVKNKKSKSSILSIIFKSSLLIIVLVILVILHKLINHVWQEADNDYLDELILFALLVMNKYWDRIEDFVSAVDLADAHNLGNIVCKYKYRDRNKSSLLFLQPISSKLQKVTEENLFCNNPNNSFNLLKYFRSYLKVREQFHESKAGDPIFGNRLQDLHCDFIIYTNAESAFGNCTEGTMAGIERIKIEKDNMLNFYTNEEFQKYYYYKLIRGVNPRLDEKIDTLKQILDCEKAITDFLGRLKIFFGQPNVCELEEILKEKMQRIALQQRDFTWTYSNLKAKLMKWMSDNTYLTKDNFNFFEPLPGKPVYLRCKL